MEDNEKKYTLKEVVDIAKGYAFYDKAKSSVHLVIHQPNSIGGIGIREAREAVQKLNMSCPDEEVKKALVPYIKNLEEKLEKLEE